MQSRLSVYILVVLSNMLISSAAFSVFAQTAGKENPQKDDFGFSLSLKKENKKPESEKSITNDAAEDDEIRIETTLIVNDVLVFDEDKKIVENLKKEDFIIREDGQPQVVEEFSFGGNEKFPRSVVLIIDHSVSQLPYLQTSIEAAKNLVDKLDPGDRMAIVTDNVELLQNFTVDKTLLKEKLDSLKKNALSGKIGKSKQYSALMAVLNELLAGENLRPIIIFQTDGDELNLLKGEILRNLLLPETLNFGFQDILTATEKTRTVIYTIIPDLKFVGITDDEKLSRAKTHLINSEKAFAEVRRSNFLPEKLKPTEKMLKRRASELSRQQSAMTKIAEVTGGWAYYLEQSEQAEKIYTEIMSNMKRRYILGYYPTNQTRDGKKRLIKAEVRGHPEYSVWCRESYIFGSNEE